MMISKLPLMAARSAAATAARQAGRQRTWNVIRSCRFSTARTAHEQRPWWSVAAATSASAIILLPLLVAAATNVPTTSAEQEGGVEEVKADELEGGEDPYDNLPETDEPTDCFLCRTFRNGPCRPVFRKVEACAKDHPGEDDTNACEKYGKAFQECSFQYPMLYAIGMLETIAQDDIRPILARFERGDGGNEVDDSESEGSFEYATLPWDISGKNKTHPSLSIDWDGWKDYVSKTDWKPRSDADPLSCPVPKVEDDGDQRVWWVKYWESTCKNQEDLEVVSVRMGVPRMLSTDDGNMQFLSYVFVTDQDGRVLGFKEAKWNDIKSEKENKQEKSSVETVDDERRALVNKYFEKQTLLALVLPDSTVGLTVQAMYEELNNSSDKMTRKLYTSPPLSLASAVHVDGE